MVPSRRLASLTFAEPLDDGHDGLELARLSVERVQVDAGPSFELAPLRPCSIFRSGLTLKDGSSISMTAIWSAIL